MSNSSSLLARSKRNRKCVIEVGYGKAVLSLTKSKPYKKRQG